MKRESNNGNETSDGKISPFSVEETVADDAVKTFKKSLISPIKFGADDIDGNSEVTFKVTGFTKKRVHSPEEEILSKDGNSVGVKSSQSHVAAKKTKQSTNI